MTHRFLKPVLLATLLFSPVQQTFAADQHRGKKFLVSGGVCLGSLALMQYFSSKIGGVENLLEDLELDDLGETVEQKISLESQIKKYKIGKYLSLVAAIATGVYAGKQAWGLGNELFASVPLRVGDIRMTDCSSKPYPLNISYSIEWPEDDSDSLKYHVWLMSDGLENTKSHIIRTYRKKSSAGFIIRPFAPGELTSNQVYLDTLDHILREQGLVLVESDD